MVCVSGGWAVCQLYTGWGKGQTCRRITGTSDPLDCCAGGGTHGESLDFFLCPELIAVTLPHISLVNILCSFLNHPNMRVAWHVQSSLWHKENGNSIHGTLAVSTRPFISEMVSVVGPSLGILKSPSQRGQEGETSRARGAGFWWRWWKPTWEFMQMVQSVRLPPPCQKTISQHQAANWRENDPIYHF